MHYTSGTTGRPKGVKRGLAEIDPDDMAELMTMLPNLFGIDPADKTPRPPLRLAALPHRRADVDGQLAAHGPHRRAHGQVDRPGDAAAHRPLRGHEQPHGADPVRPPARRPRGGAGPLRHGLAAQHDPRRRTLPPRGQAPDDRVVGRHDPGVLRGHRGRRHDHLRQGVARAPGSVGLPWPGVGDPHLRRRRQPARRRPDRHRLHAADGRLRVQGRRRRRPGRTASRTSSPSATSASSTRTATCSSATARAT